MVHKSNDSISLHLLPRSSQVQPAKEEVINHSVQYFDAYDGARCNPFRRHSLEEAARPTKDQTTFADDLSLNKGFRWGSSLLQLTYRW